jgi:hypothetical protein
VTWPTARIRDAAPVLFPQFAFASEEVATAKTPELSPTDCRDFPLTFIELRFTLITGWNMGHQPMKISVENLRKAAGIAGQAAGPEAAIVVQFVVDLAVTARFTAAVEEITPQEAYRLLRLRLIRHRALTYQTTDSIH